MELSTKYSGLDLSLAETGLSGVSTSVFLGALQGILKHSLGCAKFESSSLRGARVEKSGREHVVTVTPNRVWSLAPPTQSSVSLGEWLYLHLLPHFHYRHDSNPQWHAVCEACGKCLGCEEHSIPVRSQWVFSAVSKHMGGNCRGKSRAECKQERRREMATLSDISVTWK